MSISDLKDASDFAVLGGNILFPRNASQHAMRWLANSHILIDREMRPAPTLSRAVGRANRSDEQRRTAQIGIAKRGLPERRIRRISPDISHSQAL
jgi:hypothetical protein